MRYPLVAISDFCQTGSGTTPSRSEDGYYGGNIPWIKSGELRENEIFGSEEFITEKALQETSLRLIPAGSILVAMYGATVGRVGILGIHATTNQAICHIIPDRAKADIRYMFHALQHKADELVSRGVGGAQPNISQGVIKRTTIPLPQVSEQKRIAAILDQADSLRRLRQRAIDRLNSLGRAIFGEMFGDSAEGRYPIVPLESVSASIDYGLTASATDREIGPKFLRITDIQDGKVNWEAVPYCDATQKEKTENRLFPSNSRPGRGRTSESGKGDWPTAGDKADLSPTNGDRATVGVGSPPSVSTSSTFGHGRWL
jgi:type I restriction enzyme S subunit